MTSPNDRPTGYLGTYFDRDAVLRLARLTGILAWIILAIYVYTTLVSIGQFWTMVATGMASYAGTNIFDRLSIPTMQFSQLQQAIVASQGPDSILRSAVGKDWKGKLSMVLYLLAIGSTFVVPWLALALYVAVALAWLVPDRRIEGALAK